MNELPDDLIKIILEFLDTKSIVNLLSTNKRLNEITEVKINKFVNVNILNKNKKFIFLKVISDSESLNLINYNIIHLRINKLIKNNFSLNNFNNLTNIICTNVGLHEFPKINCLTNLKYIDFSFNNIFLIPEDLPNYIEIMYLDYNNIDFIPKLPESLRLINLSNNNVYMIPMNSFPNNIKHIYLDKNYLIDIDFIKTLREKYKKTYISFS